MSECSGTSGSAQPRAASLRAVVVAGLAAMVAGLLAMPAAGALRAARPYDFNGDGYADLAIGAPGVDVGAASDAGALSILYGAKDGVMTAGNQQWTQDSVGVLGEAATGDRFGSSSTSADFNRDGYADLAIGAEDDEDAGAVHVLYGTAAGLAAPGLAAGHRRFVRVGRAG